MGANCSWGDGVDWGVRVAAATGANSSNASRCDVVPDVRLAEMRSNCPSREMASSSLLLSLAY